MNVIKTHYNVNKVDYKTKSVKVENKLPQKNCTHIIQNPTFKGGVKTVSNKNVFKRFLPFLATTFITITNCSCFPSRTDSCNTVEGIKVECFDIKEDTKNTIERAIIDARSKCTSSKFMDNVSVDVAKKFSSLDSSSAFRRYMRTIDNISILGSSFYSDKSIPKNIVVQENSHSSFDARFSNSNSIEMNNALRFTLMHEFGHHFDKYYGHDHDADFAIEYDKMLSRMAQRDSSLVYQTPKEEKDMLISYNYNKQNSLSDKAEFKEAFKKDLQHIAYIKNSGDGELSKNIQYFIGNIDFSKEITDEIVETKDALRSEVYANLFSYGIGENNGDKDAFISNFANCYRVVKENMRKYIGVQ